MSFQPPNSEVSERLASIGVESYTSWQHPLQAAQIYMHPEAVRSVSSRALQSLKVHPRSEIGGLLWGRKPKSPNDPSVLVVYAEIIASETALYNTSLADAANLVRAINCSRTGSGLSLVGYFRSHVRKDLYLSREDQDFIEKYVRDPSSIFLVVRPFEIGICMAGFFFWDGDRLQTDTSDLEVPFVPTPRPADAQAASHTDGELKAARILNAIQADSEVEGIRSRGINGGEPSTRSDLIGNQPSMRDGNSPVFDPARKRRSVFFLQLALVGGLAAIAGVAGYWAIPAFRSQLKSLNYTAGQLGLEVARGADGQLSLSWNRNAPQFAAAHNAKLTIVDGPLNRELRIDNLQLRSGKLTYFPSGADVQFRLEVDLGNSASIAESVRVVLPGAQISTVEQTITPQPVEKARGSSTPMQMPQHSATMAQTSGQNDAKRLIPFKATALPTPQQIASTRRSHLFAHLAMFSQIQASLSGPSTSYEDSRQDQVALGLPIVLLPPPPAWSDIAPRVSDRSNPLVISSTPPDPVRLSTPMYVAPRPLKQVTPDPTLLRSAVIYELTEIEVQLRIDPAGHVINARAASNRKKANSFLTRAAIAAAKGWIFEPARLRGHAVAADYAIVFDFRPPVN
jgi:hypothetical protein